MANRPPRLLAANLRGPFQQQRQHTKLHMGDDPMGPPMVDRTRLQPGGLHPPEAAFNGTITNDKFCMTRTGRLHLTWWRRPLRSRPAGADASGYPSDETSR